MSNANLTDYTNTPEQAGAVRRVAAAALADLGATTEVVAYNMDPIAGYVVLRSGGFETVVLRDGTITDQVPA